jgi:hypothetical protein
MNAAMLAMIKNIPRCFMCPPIAVTANFGSCLFHWVRCHQCKAEHSPPGSPESPLSPRSSKPLGGSPFPISGKRLVSILPSAPPGGSWWAHPALAQAGQGWQWAAVAQTCAPTAPPAVLRPGVRDVSRLRWSAASLPIKAKKERLKPLFFYARHFPWSTIGHGVVESSKLQILRAAFLLAASASTSAQ